MARTSMYMAGSLPLMSTWDAVAVPCRVQLRAAVDRRNNHGWIFRSREPDGEGETDKLRGGTGQHQAFLDDHAASHLLISVDGKGRGKVGVAPHFGGGVDDLPNVRSRLHQSEVLADLDRDALHHADIKSNSDACGSHQCSGIDQAKEFDALAGIGWNAKRSRGRNGEYLAGIREVQGTTHVLCGECAAF